MPWDTSNMSYPKQKHNLSQISNAVISDSVKLETSVSSITPLFIYLPSTNYFKMSPKSSSFSLSSRPQLSWMIIEAPWMGFPPSSYSVTLLSYLLSSQIWSMSCSKLCLVAWGLGAFRHSTPLMVLPHPTSGALILLTAPSPLLEHGSHTCFLPCTWRYLPIYHVLSWPWTFPLRYTSVCFWIPLPSGFSSFTCS